MKHQIQDFLLGFEVNSQQPININEIGSDLATQNLVPSFSKDNRQYLLLCELYFDY